MRNMQTLTGKLNFSLCLLELHMVLNLNEK